MPRSAPRSRPLAAAFLAAALFSAGCRQGMYDQPVVEPFEASEVFSDGVGGRTPPAGTIARGLLQTDTRFWAGLDDAGRPVAEIPVTVTADLLNRGRSRYEAFCSPCHDRGGDGRGMIVRRGFKQPSSFHEERLRQQPVGYFFNVVSNGFGQMSSYAAQLEPHDRWAIVAYLRTLQWSRVAHLADLPSEIRTSIAAELEMQEAAAAAGPAEPNPE